MSVEMMRQVEGPRSKFQYAMRSIASGGERLGQEMLEWGHETFGLAVNEFYGQTEANLTVGNCASIITLERGLHGPADSGTCPGSRG